MRTVDAGLHLHDEQTHTCVATQTCVNEHELPFVCAFEGGACVSGVSE